MSVSVYILFLAMLIIGISFVRVRIKAHRLSSLSWDDLLARLQPLPHDQIATIALDYLHPRKGQLEIDTATFWTMIGEADGLMKMYNNTSVLIALATYAQRWNRVESLIVAKRMQRDAAVLRRATLRLCLGLVRGYDRVEGPFSVQEAASSYYLMRARVLALYETSHAGRLARLTAAL